LAYTANTTNNTNTITAIADADATVSIDVDGMTVANGTSVMWDSGINTVTITVASGGSQTIYTVRVNKS